MSWFQGGSAANFFLWQDDSGAILSWKLEAGEDFIAWSTGRLETGTLRRQLADPLALLRPWEPSEFKVDANTNLELRQFAIDVFMAWQSPDRDQILATVLAPALASAEASV